MRTEPDCTAPPAVRVPEIVAFPAMLTPFANEVFGLTSRIAFAAGPWGRAAGELGKADERGGVGVGEGEWEGGSGGFVAGGKSRVVKKFPMLCQREAASLSKEARMRESCRLANTGVRSVSETEKA